jgi:hypothetical protein
MSAMSSSSMTPAKRVTMSQLIGNAQNRDNRFSEIALGPDEVAFETDGVLANGDLIPMDQSSRGRLFGKIGAPARYFETHSARFQVAALNEHAARGDFGRRPTLVVREGLEAFIYRLVCRNGMTRRECMRDGIARTRKLPAEFPNNRELQMSQIRRLTRQNWNRLQAQLEALRATGERTADVEKLLRQWLLQARMLTTTLLDRLLAAWRTDGSERTNYGAVNALTWVATHDQELSDKRRRALAALAGLLAFSEVHICERCFSVIARSAEG